MILIWCHLSHKYSYFKCGTAVLHVGQTSFFFFNFCFGVLKRTHPFIEWDEPSMCMLLSNCLNRELPDDDAHSSWHS